MAGTLSAQMTITTRKMKINDFSIKTTKVVLSGNVLFDGVFKSEIGSRWRVSPFEFCTAEEFQKQKTNSEYYFLVVTTEEDSKKSAPGLSMLTLFKGGLPKNSKEVKNNKASAIVEIVSIPIASSEDPNGRELTFLPAILDILQDFTLKAMTQDRIAYGGVRTFAKPLFLSKGMKIIVSNEDLAPSVSPQLGWEEKGLYVMTRDDADMYMSDEEPNYLVSYIVAPSEPKPGSIYYKMLISSDTHELFYFKKERALSDGEIGFAKNEIERMISSRKLPR